MAHFAELNEEYTDSGVQNYVTRVVVVNNDVITVDGEEKEEVGADFLTNLCGGQWKQTSYNNNFRKNYAGIGYKYDQTKDAFIAPKPYPSWLLDDDTCRWDTPVPYPDDGKMYRWNEPTTSWIEMD
jgi:hypothetical protein|tara:strand:- start:41 stop:418 length:378 start_codon:yes stop_codon:yes gene_type:complete